MPWPLLLFTTNARKVLRFYSELHCKCTDAQRKFCMYLMKYISSEIFRFFLFPYIHIAPGMATSSTTPIQQNEGLWIFLQNRGIPEENIRKMQQDHVSQNIFTHAIPIFFNKYKFQILRQSEVLGLNSPWNRRHASTPGSYLPHPDAHTNLSSAPCFPQCLTQCKTLHALWGASLSWYQCFRSHLIPPFHTIRPHLSSSNNIPMSNVWESMSHIFLTYSLMLSM